MSSATSSSASAGGETSSSSSAGGAGGGGGMGGAGGVVMVCTPNVSMACPYNGPVGTEGVGTCRAGSQTCAPDGSAWGPCTGEVDPAKENCATPEDESCDAAISPCGANSLWSHRFGDASDHQFPTSLALDDAANIIITGNFAGTIDFGGGPLVSVTTVDPFVAKFDPSGASLWSKSFNGDFQKPAIATNGLGDIIVAGGIVGPIDFGGGVLAGHDMSPDVAIAMFDAGGKWLWSKRFSVAPSGAYSLATATLPTGEILIAGAADGAADFGCGSISFPGGGTGGGFLVELDAQGDCIWSTGITSSLLHAPALGVDPTGGVFLVGAFHGYANFGGGMLGNQGSDDWLYLAKFDAAGQHVFAEGWDAGQDNSVGAAGVVVNAAGEPFVVGSLYGPFPAATPSINFGTGSIGVTGSGAFVVSFDALGKAQWAIGMDGYGEASGMAFDMNGDLIVAAQLFSGAPVMEGPTMLSLMGGGSYIARVDQMGNVLGAVGWSGAGGPHVAVDGLNNVVLAGPLPGTVDFGQGPLKSAGGSDVYLADVGP